MIGFNLEFIYLFFIFSNVRIDNDNNEILATSVATTKR